MATNPNMEAIETITVGATSAANITFSNIPQGYTDLVLKISGRHDTSSDQGIFIKFNGSTSNRSHRYVAGNGTTPESSSGTDGYIGSIQGTNATANTFNNTEVYIPNYASSNNKSFSVDNVTENNATTAYANLIAGLWSNSAAITSIAITVGNGTQNFVQHSSATLYGITNAAVGAKATGGIISETDTHWIHTFTASGTFTPSQNLTADYLVVAGGGGGGSSAAGGGGAGGLRSTVTATGGGGSLESALSLSANTNYTVTVGAGGAGTSVSGDGTANGTNGNNSVFSTITSTGGGGGSGKVNQGPPNINGATGGSGGGGASNNGGSGTGTAAAGTANQGYAGGIGSAVSSGGYSGGGGGGAGAVGSNGSGNSGGAGGAGVAVAISGSSVTYAGGGGGGGTSAGGAGGAGGGGAGAPSNDSATAGTANTGGGGGGARRDNNTTGQGAAGGSGIVIVRYAK